MVELVCGKEAAQLLEKHVINKIFLDIDDVLNEFSMAALHYVGATGTHLPYTKYPDCGWDIVEAANVLRKPGSWAYGVEEFWGTLGESFWANIPRTPDCYKLITWCAAQVGEDNLYLATCATKSPACAAGKLRWIHEFMPKFLHRQYMIGAQKSLLADSNSLLIDDRIKNCELFRNAGGSAILVSRPWNQFPWKKGMDRASIQLGLAQYLNDEREL